MSDINFIIDEEFAIYSHATDREMKNLEDSLLTYGWWKGHKIIVDRQTKIVTEGMKRYLLCVKHGIMPEFQYEDFESRIVIKRHILESKLLQKHLTNFEKAELIHPLADVETELARQRKLATLKNTKSLIGAFDPNDKGKALELLAKRYGMSYATLERSFVIINNKDDELIEKVRTGKLSIDRGAKIIRRAEPRKKALLPEGKWSHITVDIPREYRNNFRGSPDNHYETMTTEQLMELKDSNGKPVQECFADNAIMMFWGSAPTLEEDLKIIHAWGFEYVTQRIWVKIKLTQDGRIQLDLNPEEVNLAIDPKMLQIGTGYRARGSHECLSICIKGKIELPDEDKRYPSVIFAERTKHSAKPDIFYEIFEKEYPGNKYLELFARDVEPRPNWTYFGNEFKPLSITVQ